MEVVVEVVVAVAGAAQPGVPEEEVVINKGSGIAGHFNASSMLMLYNIKRGVGTMSMLRRNRMIQHLKVKSAACVLPQARPAGTSHPASRGTTAHQGQPPPHRQSVLAPLEAARSVNFGSGIQAEVVRM